MTDTYQRDYQRTRYGWGNPEPSARQLRARAERNADRRDEPASRTAGRQELAKLEWEIVHKLKQGDYAQIEKSARRAAKIVAALKHL